MIANILKVPPSGGSLEIGNKASEPSAMSRPGQCSPFGGIPRNWKPELLPRSLERIGIGVPPSGGSLEIGNGPSCPHW